MEISKINLSLQTRFSFKTNISESSLLFFDGADIPFNNLIAAGKTIVLESLKDPGGLVVILVEKVVNNLAVRIKERNPLICFLIAGGNYSVEIMHYFAKSS